MLHLETPIRANEAGTRIIATPTFKSKLANYANYTLIISLILNCLIFNPVSFKHSTSILLI